jgi:hypothetical protein
MFADSSEENDSAVGRIIVSVTYGLPVKSSDDEVSALQRFPRHVLIVYPRAVRCTSRASDGHRRDRNYTW